jgi:hypothetical protein
MKGRTFSHQRRTEPRQCGIITERSFWIGVYPGLATATCSTMPPTASASSSGSGSEPAAAAHFLPEDRDHISCGTPGRLWPRTRRRTLLHHRRPPAFIGKWLLESLAAANDELDANDQRHDCSAATPHDFKAEVPHLAAPAPSSQWLVGEPAEFDFPTPGDSTMS